MTLPTAIPDFLRPLRQAVEFTHPHLAWLLLVVPLGWLALRIVANRRRRRRTATVLLPGFAAQLMRRRLSRRTAWPAAVGTALFLFGLLGPHWGRGEDDGIAVGRDLVLVVDLSRSMNAEDTQGPSRAAAALRAASDLTAALPAFGAGHRVGVVVFAARAKVLVPLTTDLDHVRLTLAELDPAHPPPEIGVTDQSRSGTRIGLGLITALGVCDDRFPQAQSIVLLSDGDDPLDDREWSAAVGPAHTKSVPVHAIGFGDPARDSTLTIRGELLEFSDAQGFADPVRTRLHEDVLKQIAFETRGLYRPARREQPSVEAFLRDVFASSGIRETSDDPVPRSRDRAGLFFGLAALLLLLAVFRR